MDFEIIWTEPAVADFEECITFVEQHSATAAEALRLEVLGHIEILQKFPKIGPVYRPDRSGKTRQIVCRSYRIFYRVDEAARHVEILTVWHGSRSEPELPN